MDSAYSKSLQYLSLSKKAGALVAGQSNVQNRIHAGKARLVLLSSDASENLERQAERMLQGHRAPLCRLPFTSAVAGHAIGRDGCAIFAIDNMGLARALSEALNTEYGHAGRPDTASPHINNNINNINNNNINNATGQSRKRITNYGQNYEQLVAQLRKKEEKMQRRRREKQQRGKKSAARSSSTTPAPTPTDKRRSKD